MGNGLLDAYIYNMATPAGKRRDEQQRAQAYSDVWQDTEAQLAEQGLKAEHHPMRTAELLLRSGNPTAMKTGQALMTQYHAGKTGDIKEHEYGLTLDDDQKEAWLAQQASAGKDVIGSTVKVRRPDGSIGYSIVRRNPDNGSIYMQDLGANAYVEDKVINVGGGMQSLYRDGNGRLTYGTHNDAMAPANGYERVDPQLQAEFEQFLQMKKLHEQRNQPVTTQTQIGPNMGTQAAQSVPQGAAPPPPTPPPTQPARVPQQPRVVPRAQPQVYGGRDQFLENVADAAATEARGTVLGKKSGQVSTEMGFDQNKIRSLMKKDKIIMPEIEGALNLIAGHGGASGGNWATGGIMEIDAIKNVLPFGSRFPSATEMVGTDAHRLAQHLNVIRTNIAFDRLQEMREESKTGGALGQVSDMENQMLKDSLVSLDQKNRPEVMIQNLQKVKHHYERVQKFMKVDFLLKHKYKVSSGGSGYDEFMQAQRSAIQQVFGTGPEGQELIDMINQLQYGPMD